ncbi:MAG: hypothetical protein RLZZ628_382 [Bacteroidota bacterium]|jgi:hypothetical protein
MEYKEKERIARAEFKKALKAQCEKNNFQTASDVSRAQSKYNKLRNDRASEIAEAKSKALIQKMKDKNKCK